MYGIKISKVGKSITSTRPYDFHLDSQYAVAKIAQEDQGVASAGDSVIITHDRQDPIFLPYVSDDGENFYLAGDYCPVVQDGAQADPETGNVFSFLMGGTGTGEYKTFTLVDAFRDV